MNPERIVSLASAFYESCVIFAASDLGIFRLIAQVGDADEKELAAAGGFNVRAARLLLDACVAIGLLVKTAGRYRNTPEAAAFLVPGAPGDLSGAIRYNRDVYGAWGKLQQLAKTGKPVEPPGLHLGEDPERTRTFVLAMHGRALGIGQAVIPHLDLGGRKRLLDIGGGPGTYSLLIAQAFPRIECTVLDLPGVVRIADELIVQSGLEARVKTIGGDYHGEELPGGNDAVIFFGVLHQEDPAAIRRLLEQAYKALDPGGVIYILDMMTDSSHTAPKFSALFALNMALTTEHGWVFSEDEIKSWLTGAGFKNFSCRPLPPPLPHWLAFARKP